MSIELPVLPDLRMELASPDVDAPLEVATLVADRTRAGILALLQAGPHCVCEMAAALGERQNNVSNHLVRLREAGFVRASRHDADSRRVYYERDEEACARALAELRTLLEPNR
jgi:ArsR family transcriptional regulator